MTHNEQLLTSSTESGLADGYKSTYKIWNLEFKHSQMRSGYRLDRVPARSLSKSGPAKAEQVTELDRLDIRRFGG